MKFWLTKFKISNALNDRKPLSPAVSRAIAQSEELRRFAEHATTLDQKLASPLPEPTASASCHAAIMRAVRATESARAEKNHLLWPRWIPVSALVLLVALSGFLALDYSRTSTTKVQSANSPMLATANSALALGGSLLREAPAAALAPMADEMRRLDRDLANTGHFLLASLP